jgi:hypothetical protein
LQFNGLWPIWLTMIVGILGFAGIARWYYRESRHVRYPLNWILPVLRGSAFAIMIAMLAGPTWYHRWVEGELSLVRIVVDQSESMSTIDRPSVAADREQDSRIGRVHSLLVGQGDKTQQAPSMLDELQKHHRVQWYGIEASPNSQRKSSTALVWESGLQGSYPKRDAMSSAGLSPIGTALSESLVDKPAAVVLITDGQVNDGMSLADASELAASEKVPVFTIGLGESSEPSDLGILFVEHSQRVFRADVLRGSVTVKERVPAGESYTVEIKQDGRIVWAKELVSFGNGVRRIEFDMPAEGLVDTAKEAIADGMEYAAVPIDLLFEIHSQTKEVSLENNRYASALWGVDRKNRVLVLDRRGGWETRYIKNALQRDAVWDATVAIGPTAFASDFFPNSRDALFEYDLTIMTLETFSSITPVQLSWLKDFVATSGGGLIVMDSNRPIDMQQVPDLESLLPVQFPDSGAVASAAIRSLQLGSFAVGQLAFGLSSTEEGNARLWSELPVPKSFRRVAVAPGADELLFGLSQDGSTTKQLLCATRLVGQGRVFYSATDETWRWRYNVADLYHQRFWNQIANWCMRSPFAVNDSFASLDTGLRMISTEDVVTIRTKLKQDGAQPLENATVQAILERDGQRIASIPLAQEPDARGFYRATAGPFAVGDYVVRLEVAGIPQDATRITSQFKVQPPIDLEMESLACNVVDLEKVASATGGSFAMIEEANTIVDKLKAYRTGKIVESKTLLWQSYPWFVTIMTLLSIEWFLRKRAGLI